MEETMYRMIFKGKSFHRFREAGTISREEKDWIRSVIRQRSGCGLPSDQTNEGESDTPEDTEAA